MVYKNPNYTEQEGFGYVDHEHPWQYQEGEYTVTRGSSWSGPGCHEGCGVLLYTDKNGKLVKVEGDPENPYNQGRLCVRCLTLPEVTNSPLRLMYPMKRAREDRGKDKFERITWEEAFDTIEMRFREIIDKYGAETIFFTQGTGRDCAAYITRLAWSLGSPSYTSFFSGFACYLPRVAGLQATTGEFWVADSSNQFMDRYDNPEWRHPEILYVWGNYPLRSNSDGYYGHAVVDMMKRGTKIVMIDPKVTWLSTKAILHLRVRPGTDAAVALAMLHVLIEEDLYDHDFVDRWCYGFDALAESVKEWTPERAAKISWVPAEKIVEAARLLGNNKPCALQWGVAVDQNKEAMPACQALIALFQITGNIDIPGGMIVPPEILNHGGGWGRELLPPEQAKKRLGLDKYALLKFGFQFAHGDTVYKSLEEDSPIKFRAGWFQQNNTLACMTPQPAAAVEVFNKMEFMVCIDLFMTPTVMAFADIVLPAATFPERNGLRFADGVQQAAAMNKVTQIGECKSDMEINLEIGRRFNPEAWPWENVDEMFDAMVGRVGFTYEEVREMGPIFLPFEYRRHEKGLFREDGTPGFNTATGRIELWSSFFNMAGLSPLPDFQEPTPGPGSTPEMMEEYPFVCITGARNWSLFHSEHRNIPRLRALHPDPTIIVHPDALKELGIKEGDWVRVENHLGHCKARVEASPVYDKRIVAIDHGWWLPEGDPENLYDVLELSAGNLLKWDCGKSGFGSNYKCSICKLTKITEE